MTEVSIKVDENGFLAGFVPKKIWYALYKQGIIQKQADKWKVDLNKRDQIRIPLEVVGSEVITSAKAKPKQDTNLYKEIFFEALKYTENQTEAYKLRMFEELPLYAVGEPRNMLASLQGKPSPLKNIHGYMLGNCGVASIKGLKLNTGYGRFLSKWEKQGDAPFRISRDNHYGNALYINLKALSGRNPIEAQCMELNAKALRYFIEKLDELLQENGIEPLHLYIWTHID